ncbi:hypothetical protein FLA_5267 [Filimonas lacunae]|nr:hypothetical protein FLA_5267 [Filimonas lacunae]
MINRHNYEEFLLMYVDNELNLHQRMELELFMEQNPDLAAELQVLQESVLLPEDNIVFNNKQDLYKHAEGDIHPELYEEQLLLYIDNELDATARARVETFVQQNASAQSELELLQQTILQVEPVAFAHKEILYRKERERRVIPIYWTRLAVAAALLGVTATSGWWFYHNSSSNSVQEATGSTTYTAKATPAEQETNGISATNNTPVVTGTRTTVPAASTTAPPPAKNHSVIAVNRPAATPSQQATTTPLAKREVNPMIVATTVTGEPSTSNQETIIAALLPDKVITAHPASQTAIADNQTETHKDIAYKELDTSVEDDQKLYVGALELNRNKVRGFFKKAGRILGAKAKAVTDDDNL